jgi:type IV pilus assembly protein PilB
MEPAKKTFEANEPLGKRLFGESLISKGLITRRNLTEALMEQRINGGRLGEVIHLLKILPEEKIARSLAEYHSMEYYHIADFSKIDIATGRMLPAATAKHFSIVILGKTEQNKIIVGMSDPLDVVAMDTISLILKQDIKFVICSSRQIRKAIEVIYHGSDVDEQSLRDLVNLEIETDNDVETLLEQDLTEADISGEMDAMKAPVIRFVNLMLSHAVKSRASDIHIEPHNNSTKIRMRVDGHLCEMVPPARKMQAAIATRVKILSKMDIAERRLPQDGRFKIKASNREIDVRVSAIPTIYGEKIVMRILDISSINHNLDHIGFEGEQLKEFKQVLSQPNGIVIITGPTGSGKSTTLYSSLNYLNAPDKNITTVEDPVEYRLEGINQIQIRPEIGLDFASCLRAILRQDPDIVLLGEIRDKETIDIAIKASLTGHLVLSTFHTNDAPSAISRMAYMGIQPYLLASTLRLVVAQRLVRRICEHCKEPINLSYELLDRLKINPEQNKDVVFYHGKGCKACGETGYFGRLPIFEFLVINNQIRKILVDGGDEQQIRTAARDKGYGGLTDSGLNSMRMGLTTAQEVINATYLEDMRI